MVYDAHPLTMRQLTNSINRMDAKDELSFEEDKRYRLYLDLRDGLKDKFDLWPAEPLENPDTE